MRSRLGARVALSAVILAIAAAAGGSAQAATAHAARSCGVGNGEGYGYTYLLSLSVRNTNCSTGKSVVRHHGHLRGWRCSRKVLDRSPTQYDAKMSCSSGRRRVYYTYTQNT